VDGTAARAQLESALRLHGPVLRPVRCTGWFSCRVWAEMSLRLHGPVLRPVRCTGWFSCRAEMSGWTWPSCSHASLSVSSLMSGSPPPFVDPGLFDLHSAYAPNFTRLSSCACVLPLSLCSLRAHNCECVKCSAPAAKPTISFPEFALPALPTVRPL